MGYNASIRMDWGIFLSFEVAASAIRDLVLPDLVPVEPAPGRAVLTLNLVHFMAGGDQVDLVENYEIDIGVVVPVDNSGHDGLPQAAAAVHVLNIASTSAEYIEICRDSGYRIHESADLAFDVSPDGFNSEVRDADGPVLSLAARFDAPAFTAFSRTGQDFIHDHRGDYRLNYVLEGEEIPALAPDSFSLTLHQHRFFLGIEPPESPPRQHAPLVLRPGHTATMSFYGPNDAEDDDSA